MIPKNWLRKQLTLKAFKALKRIDVVPLPLGYTKESIVDKDKSVWWNEPAFANRPEYEAFMMDYEDGDEIWEYAMPIARGSVGLGIGMTVTGLSGYALVRKDEVIGHFITGA